MGVAEIYLGKKQKFMTAVSNLETVEPLWMGPERKKETLDEFFRTELSAEQRRGDLRGHVETLSAEPGAMGTARPHHL